jgi:hypothetical protein
MHGDVPIYDCDTCSVAVAVMTTADPEAVPLELVRDELPEDEALLELLELEPDEDLEDEELFPVEVTLVPLVPVVIVAVVAVVPPLDGVVVLSTFSDSVVNCPTSSCRLACASFCSDLRRIVLEWRNGSLIPPLSPLSTLAVSSGDFGGGEVAAENYMFTRSAAVKFTMRQDRSLLCTCPTLLPGETRLKGPSGFSFTVAFYQY